MAAPMAFESAVATTVEPIIDQPTNLERWMDVQQVKRFYSSTHHDGSLR
jgi:hypothetical protein